MITKIKIKIKAMIKITNDKDKDNGNSYCHFFSPKIVELLSKQRIQNIKEELLSKDPEILEYLNERR